MSYFDGIIIFLIICIVAYEAIFGYHTNVKFKPCPSCEEYNVSPIYADKADAAALIERTDHKIKILIKYLEENRAQYHSPLIQYGIGQLMRNYDNDNIHEISPNNIMQRTSFLRDKKTLVLCLRRKTDGQLHDDNTICFVVLHEMAHMMNEGIGHTETFWRLFKFLLEQGVQCGIYHPIDYSMEPVVYCGLDIKYSPLFSDLKSL
jgi:hypothetical protein